MADDGSMRAWRTHEYGERPTEVLQLDTVPIPDPEAGEVRVRVQAIPLNLNDLERINGGNMMVRPELPYSPGMEVMGVVDACGAGAEEFAGRRVVATTKGANGGFAEYAICPTATVFDIPESIPLPDAAALFFPFHLAWLGLFDRADLRSGESVLIHAGAGGSGRRQFSSLSTAARACSQPPAATRRCHCAASSALMSRSTIAKPTSARSCSTRLTAAGSTSCSTTSVKP